MAEILPHAVFLDIDGTVLNPLSPTGLSPTVCRVLADMRRRGHYFFINTGRAPGYIPFDAVPREHFDGYCAALGAYADFHGKILYENLLSAALLHELIDYCDEHKETCMIEGEPDDCDGRYSFRNEGEFHAPRYYYDKDELFSAINGRKMYKITVPYIPNDSFRAFLEQYFEMVYCSEVEAADEIRAEAAYAEGAAKGFNKGSAVKRVCALLNIPIERSIAIGDSENDLGMLHAAGISVAMGSAPDEVKRECTFVTDTVGNDGAARAIIRILAPESEKEYFA